MADISDVLTSLVDAIGAVVYPGGSGGASAIGAPCTIKPGWPVADELDRLLRAGSMMITVFQSPGMARNTSRYERRWQTASITPATLSATVSGRVLTIAGAPAVGQIVGVVIDQAAAYTYSVAAGDTPSTIAAALAVAIPGATASGAAVTFANTAAVARVTTTATENLELRRQDQAFKVTFWSPTPSLRAAAGKMVDAALAATDFLTFADGSSGWIRYHGTRDDDEPSKENLWRRDIDYMVEYPTVLTDSFAVMMIGELNVNSATINYITVPNTPPAPLVGAIRFDGVWDPAGATASTSGTVADQLAAVLAVSAYKYRLPFFSSGAASWPAQTQATMDAEISAAVTAGLNYWAFDSYQPTDPETSALSFYLSSAVRSQMQFCMLGQFSNWSLSGGAPYSAAAQRDITMFAQAGYVQVLGGRPLYYVLNSGTNTQMQAAVTWIRAQSAAQGTGDPYVVLLSGAAILDFNNVTVAEAIGADAAGAYECPRLRGYPQPYSQLVTDTETDWTNRAAAGLPMVPLAMTDFDPRPLIQTPVPFYTIPGGWNLSNYYQAGTAAQIAQHVADMVTFMAANRNACLANVGLVYAWNEQAEGGQCLMPSYLAGDPFGDPTRAIALGALLAAA